MLLAIDAGNTTITFAVFDRDQLRVCWRLRTDPGRTGDEYAALLHPLFSQAGLSFADIREAVLACVVPAVTPDLLRLAGAAFGLEPFSVTGDIDCGLRIGYHPPGDVGPDRIADAVAAVHRHGAPCIVIDFGTATTFNAIARPDPGDDRPVYRGGAICPGIGLSRDALFARAARLFPVELARPPHAIGDNTVEAVQSGFVYGYVGQIAGLVARFRAELDAEDCPVIATGGHTEDVIVRECASITAREPLLTLEGLRLIAQRHRPAR